jgi:hypothetical protein
VEDVERCAVKIGWCSAVVAVIALSVVPAPVIGVGSLHPDHVTIASGTRQDIVSRLVPRPGGRATSWSLEVSDRELFGAALRQSGARGVFAYRVWRVEIEAAQVAADVGRETRVATYFGRSSSTSLLSVGLVHESVVIGRARAFRLTSLDLRTGVLVNERVGVRCDVEGFQIAGDDLSGADVETSVTVLAAAGVGVGAALAHDRSLGAHARVSVAVRLVDRAVVVAGYDDASEALSLAIVVMAGSLRGVAGASMHSVLGLSHGVSVGWTR